MHHRSHDREALDGSSEPGPSLGPGSRISPDDLRTRLHEAANWLAVLRGHVDLASERRGVDPDLLASLRRSLAGIERALGADTPGLERVDVGRFVRELAGDARLLRPGLDLFVDAPARGVLVVETRPAALRDVLLNLLKNAAEAIEPTTDGQVRVGVRPTDAGIRFTVEDDGPGMPPEVRDRCFERGFSTKASEGRGLGLARVAALVEELGGTIDVRSRPGAGTRFETTLPLAASDGAAAVPARVLVVDDDPDVGEVLVEMMDALGVEAPRAVTDPRQVPGLCRGGRWDVVLLDRDLGDARGDHLAIEVRQVDPAVAIVLLTGDPLIADDAPRGALDRALTKPIGLDALRRCLHEAHVLTRERRREHPGRAASEDA